MRTRKSIRRMTVLAASTLFMMMAPLPHLSFIEQSVGAAVDLPAPDPATPAEMGEVQAAADEPLVTPRVQAADADVEEFSLMGVVFDTPPEEPVMVRVRDAAGTWGDWQELEVPLDEGPDNPTNYGTEPFWVGPSQGYEVNLDTGDSADASVVLVRKELRRAVAVSEPVAGAANTPPFGINPRASWGARAVGPMSYGSTIKKGIVHHTDSGNSYSPAQVPGIIAGIQAYHMDGRGWADIGYNFVVDRFGGIWEARAGGIDRPVVGAHASGFNTNTVGVSVIGDYTAATPSAQTLESVSKVIGWKMYLHGLDPAAGGAFTSGGGPRYPAGTVVNIANVVGHGDVGATSCPGSIEGSLGLIRARAQDWKNHFVANYGPPGIPGGPPFGYFDGIYQNGGYVNVWGWTKDPDVPNSSLSVHVILDDRQSWAVPADYPRPDVAAAFPGYSARAGYGFEFRLAPGTHKICAVAINAGAGSNVLLGCQTVVVK